jgi:LysM repeat protein
MANKGLIFYGKPQSFERYELTGGRINEDERNEPRLKLPSDRNEILHYFFKEGYYYLELYGYANPYKDVRPGVVIGVCVKSDEQIAISKENMCRLKKLLDDFKEIALSNTKFKALKLSGIGDFMTTIHNHSAVESILSEFKISKKQEPFRKSVTLLYLDDFENKVDAIKDKISDFADIYISADKDVFSDDLNIAIFHEAQKKFHVVIDNEIRVSEEKKLISPQPKDNSINEIKEFKSTDPLEFEKLQTDFNRFKAGVSWTIKWIRILICTSAVYLILIIAFFFGTNSPLDKWFPPDNGRQNTKVGEQDDRKESSSIGHKPDEVAEEGKKTLGDSVVGVVSDDNDGNNNAVDTKETPTGISITSTTVQIEEGKSIKLTAEILPESVTVNFNSDVEWELTNNNGNATLTTPSSSGKFGKTATIKGVKAGSASVKAKIKNTELSAEKQITVNAKVNKQENEHTVYQGETLILIAKKYGVTVEDLKLLNHLSDDNIQPGQKLKLHP